MSRDKIFRFLGLSAALLAAGTTALAANKTVDTSKEAIAIGMKVCDQSWGAFKRRQGQKWKPDAKLWSAKLDGDHWFVWMGDEKASTMHISVAHDGRPPNVRTDCLLTVRE